MRDTAKLLEEREQRAQKDTESIAEELQAVNAEAEECREALKTSERSAEVKFRLSAERSIPS